MIPQEHRVSGDFNSLFVDFLKKKQQI